jgi:hypothetical protein
MSEAARQDIEQKITGRFRMGPPSGLDLEDGVSDMEILRAPPMPLLETPGSIDGSGYARDANGERDCGLAGRCSRPRARRLNPECELGRLACRRIRYRISVVSFPGPLAVAGSVLNASLSSGGKQPATASLRGL